MNSTIGVESWWAVCTPIDALVAPGPRVTKATPGWPVSLAYASAMKVDPDSCRLTTSLIMSRAVVQRVKHGKIAFARHAEGVIDALDQQLINEQAGAGAGGCISGLRRGSGGAIGVLAQRPRSVPRAGVDSKTWSSELPMSEVPTSKVDLDAVAQLVAQLERDLERARSGASVDTLRAEVEQLR